MGFEDRFRMSVHAVIANDRNEVLLLKANYGSKSWGLPGGAIEPGETIHETLERECFEEIGIKVDIGELTGVYYHKAYDSQVVLFRCKINNKENIKLSNEHTEFKFIPLSYRSKVIRYFDPIFLKTSATPSIKDFLLK